jgi:hypothetical protein
VPNNSPVDPAAAMMAKTTNTIAAMRKIPILMLCDLSLLSPLYGVKGEGEQWRWRESNSRAATITTPDALR